MRRALLGRSGTVVGLDYRGEVVMAAHEPVTELDLGIVAKIDISEIRAPFIEAGLIAGFFAVVVVVAGATLFVRISHPMIKLIEKRNEELAITNKNLKQEINERKRAEDKLQKTHTELETRVKERTAELSESNAFLKIEIAERKQNEEALKLNEARLEALVKLSQFTDESQKEISDFVLDQGVALTGSDMGFLGFMNEKETDMTIHAWSRNAMQQCSVIDQPIHFPIEKSGLWGDAVKKRKPIVVNDYSITNLQKKGYPKGHVKISRFLAVPVFDRGQIVVVIGMANKKEEYEKTDIRQLTLLLDGMWRIMQRKRAEEQLRQNKAMLQAVFDGILDPLVLIRKDMTPKMLNRAAATYYGLTDPQETIGKLCYQVFKGRSDPCEECRVPWAISNGQNISYERKGLMDPNRFEEVVVYHLNGNGDGPGDVIIHISDVTERRLFQKQLIQKEKLASLGVLVSSIAHEISNPNSFVSFNIPILRDYIDEMIPIVDDYATEHAEFEVCHLPYPEFRQDIFKLLDNIENGSVRISSFVSNLRDFSQEKVGMRQKWVELKDVIERVLSICHSKIKNSVKSFVKNVPEDLPTILTEPYALEQILLNLLINATQAMDKKDSWIKLIVSVFDGRQDQLSIEVSDNGCGMDEETQLKIFDPFFTTKSPMDGTGLGLYVCHTMAEGLNGRIELESEPGKGSIFKLILPVENKN
jgi:signal transduction histidine kinase